MFGWLMPRYQARLAQRMYEVTERPYVPPPDMTEDKANELMAGLTPAAVEERPLTDDEVDAIIADALGDERPPTAAEREYSRLIQESLEYLAEIADSPEGQDLADDLMALAALSPKEWRKILGKAQRRTRQREEREAGRAALAEQLFEELSLESAENVNAFLEDIYSALPAIESSTDPRAAELSKDILAALTAVERVLDEREGEGHQEEVEVLGRVGKVDTKNGSVIIAGPFPLWRDEENGTRTPLPPPTREQLLANFTSRGSRDQPYLPYLSLEGGGAWGAWEPWKSNSRGEGSEGMVRLNGDAPFKRIFSMWPMLQRRYDTATRVIFRFDEVPVASDPGTVGMWHRSPFPVGVARGNCCIEILCAQFPSKEGPLRGLKLADDGGFYRAQAEKAIHLIKRSIECCTRGGHPIYQTKRADPVTKKSEWIYAVTAKSPLVRLYDLDGHANASQPTFPCGRDSPSVGSFMNWLDADGERDPQGKCEVDWAFVDVVDFDPFCDYFCVKKAYPGMQCLWPVGPGCAAVTFIDSEVLPRLLRMRKSFKEIQVRARELKVEEPEFIMKTSPFAVDVAAWRKQNDFAPTPGPFLDLWRAARFEPVPYLCENPPAADEVHARDMNTAYEGCWGNERCRFWTDAHKASWNKYGLPSEKMAPIAAPSMAVLERTGLVVATLDLERCHPWVQFLCRGRARGVYTTLRLGTWVACGAAVVSSLEFAVLAGPRWPDGSRPPGRVWSAPKAGQGQAPSWGRRMAEPGDEGYAETHRDLKSKAWGRQAIGRLVPSEQSSTKHIIAATEEEATHLAHGLAAMDELLGFQREFIPLAPILTPIPDLSAQEMAALLAELKVPEPGAPGAEPARAPAPTGAGEFCPWDSEIDSILSDLSRPTDVPRAEPPPITDEQWGAVLDSIISEPPPARDRDSVFRLLAKGDPCRNSAHHIHAFILDYTAIAVDREIFAHEWRTVVAVKTDSVALVASEQFSTIVVGDEPAQWKAEAWKPVAYPPWAPRPLDRVDECIAGLAGSTWADEPLAYSVVSSAAAGKIHIVEGPPGYGKTHMCAKALPANALLLAPTHKLKRKLQTEHGNDPNAGDSPSYAFWQTAPKSGYRGFYTWQYALKPAPCFSMIRLRVPPRSVVYWTEVGKVPRGDAQELMTFLISRWDCLVLADGDRKQGKPVMASDPWPALDAIAEFTILSPESGHRDFRSKTPELARLKMDLRALPTNRSVFERVQAEVGGLDYGQFLEDWHPRDYVYLAVHGKGADEGRKKVEADLARVHAATHPGELARVRYGEAAGKRNGEEEYIALGLRPPPGSAFARTATYSSCQGDTAGPDSQGVSPRVWLFTERCTEFFKNEAYVAATRVEYASQLGIVTSFPLTAAQEAQNAYDFS